MNRRKFLALTGFLPFFGLKKLLGNSDRGFRNTNFISKLTRDVNEIVDIHPSLNYKIISKEGSKMSDGLQVPALADGMGCS